MLQQRPRLGLILFLLAGGFLLARAARAEELLVELRPLPATPHQLKAKVKAAQVIADRATYWNSDAVGQALVDFAGQELTGRPLELQLKTSAGQVVWQQRIEQPTEPRLALLWRAGTLPVGEYELSAQLGGEPTVAAATKFTRVDRSAPTVPFPPDGIPLEVQPQDVWPDGSVPICFGVPFPEGTVTDAGTVQLLEDGQPVAAAIDPIAWWFPQPASGKTAAGNSVRWAHVKFVAHYRKGQPRRYTLNQATRATRLTPKQPATVRQEGDHYLLDNGIIRVQVGAKRFAGIEQAWVDLNSDGKFTQDELTLTAGGQSAGPYLIDQRGIRFEAGNDPDATVVIEEAGPMRVVLAAEGWYQHPKLDERAGPRLCRFRTRLTLWAGQSQVQVQHHTILTFDSDRMRLLDVGFHLPTPLIQEWRFGHDNQMTAGKLAEKGGVAYLHQLRHDRARIEGLFDKDGKPITKQVGRSDGWFTALLQAGKSSPTTGKAGGKASDDELLNDLGFHQPAFSVTLRDIWQKFPKELQVTNTGATVHTWPAHGLIAYTPEETWPISELYKLRFFHQGRLLDLRFPAQAFDMLMDAQQTERWIDPEDMKFAALSGSARGVALASEFTVRLHSAEVQDIGAWAKLAQLKPHARAQGEWFARSRTEGDIAPRDAARFPELEKVFDHAYTDYLQSVNERSGEYGMFIFANTHNHWYADENRAAIHRVWQAGHYQQVYTPWMLFLRGNSFDILRWARAYGDHYRDVDTINYDNPEQPLPFHSPGAMYHAKGFTPWGTSGYGAREAEGNITGNMGHAGVQAHFIHPDCLLMRWLVEGDARSRDVYQLWADTYSRHSRIYGGASREINNTLGEALNLYWHTWDPDALAAIAVSWEGMLATPMTKMYAPYHHPVWHLAWFDRLYRLRRDERVPAALTEYTATYPNHLWAQTFMYRLTGDAAWLQRGMTGVYQLARERYDHPGDPMHGYGAAFSATGNWMMRAIPAWLAAVRDAGITQLTFAAERGIYPSRGTHPQFIASEGPALELLTYNPEGKDFSITLEAVPGQDHYGPALRVFGPNDKLVVDEAAPTKTERYLGENIRRIKVPAQGAAGWYRLDFRNWGNLPFYAPLTDLPVEASVWKRDLRYQPSASIVGHLMPVGSTEPFTLHFQALKRYDKVAPSYICIRDANNQVLLETSLLFGSQRADAQLTIDPAATALPLHVEIISGWGPQLSFTGGPEQLYFAQNRAALDQLAKLLKP